MRILEATDYEKMSRIAADQITALIKCKPTCVLGLATGSTPTGMYKELIRDYTNDVIDFSRVISINLDEYKGLAPDHPQSYRYFMNQNLFNHVNIKKENTYVPDGLCPDAVAACRQYDSVISKYGPIDLQVLGIGHDGHIGFNEPADQYTPDTHCVSLTRMTIAANKRFFSSENDVPRQAYTMGIRPIIQARTILLLASGIEKAEILKKALSGPITPQVPASILQLHQNLIVVGDKEALEKIK